VLLDLMTTRLVANEMDEMNAHCDRGVEQLKSEVDLKMQAVTADIARLEAAFQAKFESHDQAHSYLREALDKAVETQNLRLEGMNEFRNQITNERLDYVRRDVMKTQLDSLDAKIDAIEANGRLARDAVSATLLARIRPLEETRTSLYTILAVAFVALTVLGLVLRFL
jgi:hypothetical protein